MKITQSRNKREGRWVRKFLGLHWRGNLFLHKMSRKPFRRHARKEIKRQEKEWEIFRGKLEKST